MDLCGAAESSSLEDGYESCFLGSALLSTGHGSELLTRAEGAGQMAGTTLCCTRLSRAVTRARGRSGAEETVRGELPCPASALLAWARLLALSFHHQITGQLQAHTQADLTYVTELPVCAEYEARLALRSSKDESGHPTPALRLVRQVRL